jgi:hypothetical protein
MNLTQDFPSAWPEPVEHAHLEIPLNEHIDLLRRGRERKLTNHGACTHNGAFSFLVLGNR